MSHNPKPSVISDHKTRTRPRERIASGTKAAVPDSRRSDCIRSLKAVRANDRGNMTAVRIAAVIKPATTANHSLECLLKRHNLAAIVDVKLTDHWLLE
jgi:hypothetical protein